MKEVLDGMSTLGDAAAANKRRVAIRLRRTLIKLSEVPSLVEWIQDGRMDHAEQIKFFQQLAPVLQPHILDRLKNGEIFDTVNNVDMCKPKEEIKNSIDNLNTAAGIANAAMNVPAAPGDPHVGRGTQAAGPANAAGDVPVVMEDPPHGGGTQAEGQGSNGNDQQPQQQGVGQQGVGQQQPQHPARQQVGVDIGDPPVIECAQARDSNYKVIRTAFVSILVVALAGSLFCYSVQQSMFEHLSVGSGEGSGGTFSVTAGDSSGDAGGAASMIAGSSSTSSGGSLTLASGDGNTSGGAVTIELQC